MANLETNDVDDLINASDILKSPTNEKVSLPSDDDDDLLKKLLEDEENDAESPQNPNDASVPSNDLNIDEDTGVGLPSFLLESNEDNQDNTQVQPEQNEWELPPDQGPLEGFEVDEEKPEWQLPPDQNPQENIGNDEQQGQEQPETLEQQDQPEQPEHLDQSEHLEQQNQNENENISNDNQQNELGDSNLNNDNNDGQNLNSEDVSNDSDDGVAVLTPTKEKTKKTESPSGKKDMPKYNSKSFKDFIERNDICFKRHYDKSVERMSSPRTIRYTNSCKEPPKVKGTPDKRPKRVQELYDASLRAGPCNSNYPIQINDKKNSQDNAKTGSPSSPTSPRQTQNPHQPKEYMSEASTILANSKFDRIIDLTIGKKQNLTKSQACGILRKFFIRSEEDRSEILKACGGDNNEEEEDDNDKNNEEETNEDKDENKTYSAESLKSILKQAASSEGGSPLVKRIRPIVRAALFDMKQPIVSPMTQKQRAAMKFDETLKTSMKKQPSSPTH